MTEKEGHNFLELVIIGGAGFLLGAFFKAIGLSRFNRSGKPISPQQFAGEMLAAGGVGMLAAWILEETHFHDSLNAVIIAMSGYIGGPLLDICYQEAQKTLQAAFSGLQKWLTEGKWDKRC